MRTSFLLLFIALLYMLPVSTVAQTLTLDDAHTEIAASLRMDVLEDPSGKLTIEQISTPDYASRFTRNTLNPPNFGRTHSTYWLRLDINKQSAKEWYLLIDSPIYQIDAWPRQQLEKLPYRTPLYRLKPDVNQKTTIYLRTNNGQALLYLPVILLDGKALLQHTILQYSFFVFVFAGLCVLLIYNLFLYLNLRDLSYLGIIGTILTVGFLNYQESQIFASYGIRPTFDGILYNTPFLLAVSSAVYFWNRLSQATDAFIDRFSLSIVWVFLCLIPFGGWWLHFRTLTMILLLLLVPVVSVLVTRQKLQKHRLVSKTYLMITVIVLSIPAFFLEQAGLSILDHHTTTYIFQAGILLAITLLSITQTEHLRILREGKERSEATNKAKDEFLTTMSHELRTPMNSVIAATNLLKQSNFPTREQAYVTRLESASSHMLGLIDNILDFAQLEKTSPTLHREHFQLEEVLNNIQQIMGLQATQKHLQLNIHHPEQQGLHLYGDPKRLSQVLINLVGNAIKFTETGSVDLFVRDETGAEEKGIRLHFEITDTGIGISPQDQLLLFRPFSQINSKRSRHYGGSGLGLAISQKLVNIMGGTLEMDSTPGTGSRFFFTLTFPLSLPVESSLTASQSSGELPSRKPDACTSPPPRILLVDDDEMNRFFGRELLNRLGVETSVTSSGAETIRQLQQHFFDLIFMDVSMPGMDGYETTHRIRSDARFVNLPIIALTAHAIPGERERCLRAGMNDYLTKPIAPADMEIMIRRWAKPGTDSPRPLVM